MLITCATALILKTHNDKLKMGACTHWLQIWTSKLWCIYGKVEQTYMSSISKVFLKRVSEKLQSEAVWWSFVNQKNDMLPMAVKEPPNFFCACYKRWKVELHCGSLKCCFHCYITHGGPSPFHALLVLQSLQEFQSGIKRRESAHLLLSIASATVDN